MEDVYRTRLLHVAALQSVEGQRVVGGHTSRVSLHSDAGHWTRLLHVAALQSVEGQLIDGGRTSRASLHSDAGHWTRLLRVAALQSTGVQLVNSGHTSRVSLLFPQCQCSLCDSQPAVAVRTIISGGQSRESAKVAGGALGNQHSLTA